MAKKFYMRL